MIKYILIFICLFSKFLFKYISLAQKDIETDIYNICYYLDHVDLMNDDDDMEYVKPCESNYYCRKIDSNGHIIGTCEKYNSLIKRLNSICNENNECDIGLICSDKKNCIVENDNPAYMVHDLDTVDNYYYCPNNLIPIDVNSDGNFICKSSEEQKMNGKCFNVETIEGSIITKKAFPDYFKVCGELSVIKNEGASTYSIKNILSNYIGSVPDGKFVYDIRACQSGFALYFYGDKKTTVPDGELSNNIFKMCVTVNEVEKYGSNCFINYTIGENSYIYNSDRVSTGLFSSDCEFIMTKIELFQQYLSKMEELKESCENVTYFNEPFTCGNDELRKLWFFYNNIEYYLLYKNDEDVINYLIQDTYHLYGFGNDSQNSQALSLFLNINYFIFLLFLLSL